MVETPESGGLMICRYLHIVMVLAAGGKGKPYI